MHTRSRPRQKLTRLALLLAIAVAAAACASGGTTASQAEGDATPSAADSAESSARSAPAADSTSSDSEERVSIGDDEALVWGNGDYGVLLAHGAAFDAASWTDQATEIAAQGATALAVENISQDGLLAAVDYLRNERGISDIAFFGGSAGADSILQLLSEQPDLADQIILLSPNRVVQGLGDQPKLFIASQDEAVADVSPELADTAPGDNNEVELLPGSAHAQNLFATDQGPRVLQLMLDRLAEFADA